jgi:hypothetical protein
MTKEHKLLLRALVLVGLILFGFYLTYEKGLLALTLASDRSHISAVILLLYTALSLHWMYLVVQLSIAQKQVDAARPLLDKAAPGQLQIDDGSLIIHPQKIPDGIYSNYLQDLLKKSRYTSEVELDHSILLEALTERLIARHAFGHFAGDMLLKLGLLGTIIGFIMMLAPVGELTDFDPGVLQQLLSQMSGGMAVALFTTIAGLVTSTLMALQYQLLDSAASRFVDSIAVSVDVLVVPLLCAREPAL